MHLINMTLFDLSQSRVYAALHRECCHAISISTCYLLLFTSWAIDLSFCCGRTGRSIIYNIYTYIIYIIIALTEVLMELIKKVLSSVLQKALRVH